ncbi:MAG TPA: hypothetical protein VHF22_15670, partial [Planctomycetota bacterium]|nr:hypothetical protein [Planctomycetota bacterium]
MTSVATSQNLAAPGPLRRLAWRVRDGLLKPVYRRTVKPVYLRVRAAFRGDGGARDAECLRLVRESDRLLVAAVRALAPPAPPPDPPWRACPLTSERLLIGHPTHRFMLCDPRDLATTARLIAIEAEAGTALALARAGAASRRALELASGPGYYTLQLASLVGDAGAVVAVEPDEARRAVLRDNLDAHRLLGRVQALAGLDALAEFAPDLAFLGDGWWELEGASRVVERLAAAGAAVRVLLRLPPPGEGREPLRAA